MGFVKGSSISHAAEAAAAAAAAPAAALLAAAAPAAALLAAALPDDAAAAGEDTDSSQQSVPKAGEHDEQCYRGIWPTRNVCHVSCHVRATLGRGKGVQQQRK